MVSGETRVIYLDKNHPANGGILAASQLIDNSMPADLPYIKLHLIPEI